MIDSIDSKVVRLTGRPMSRLDRVEKRSEQMAILAALAKHPAISRLPLAKVVEVMGHSTDGAAIFNDLHNLLWTPEFEHLREYL